MKSVSDVIAILLMLVVTIGLVGLAYSYISGIFSAKTAVVLTIETTATSCTPDKIIVFVRNDGTRSSDNVVVQAFHPSSGASGQCSISSISAGNVSSCEITRTTLTGAGYYRIVATTSGSSASGVVYCAS